MAIGKVELLGELGRGAGSVVFKVRRADDGKIYALKVVKVAKPDDVRFVEQVETEFAVASRFDHPNLCRIFRCDVEKSLFGKPKGAKLLMEFVDGAPLAAKSPLELHKLLAIFARAARGLAHMHALGYLHADIKPENILVTRLGETKVIDFGVVWHLGERKERVQGTLDYLAPEQAKKKIVTPRTDVFNFGATMYRTLVGGSIPTQYREPGMSKIQDIDRLVKPLSELEMAIPEDVDGFVRRCIRYRADERPAGMQEAFAELKELAEKYIARRRGHQREANEEEE